MTVKYEYKSTCCGHEYVEMRAVDEAMFFSTCNDCGNGAYTLVKETPLSEIVERVEGPKTLETQEIPTE